MRRWIVAGANWLATLVNQATITAGDAGNSPPCCTKYRTSLAFSLRVAGPLLGWPPMSDITPSDTQARAIATIQEMSNQIEIAIKEQGKVSGEISQNINSIRKTSELVTQSAESSSAMFDDLEQLSHQQQLLVGQFKV